MNENKAALPRNIQGMVNRNIPKVKQSDVTRNIRS